MEDATVKPEVLQARPRGRKAATAEPKGAGRAAAMRGLPLRRRPRACVPKRGRKRRHASSRASSSHRGRRVRARKASSRGSSTTHGRRKRVGKTTKSPKRK
ncbi:hypothetical protein MTO96_000444 [Rhipicephalus appendiculatus]